MRNKLFFGLFFSAVLSAVFFTTSVNANPDIQHWTTKNGARVYFVPAPELPIVDMNIIFDAGAGRTQRRSIGRTV